MYFYSKQVQSASAPAGANTPKAAINPGSPLILDVDVYRRKADHAGSGELTNPVTKKVMAPKFLGGESPDTKGQDRRAVLAKWLASPKNPYFARSVVNRVWFHLNGRGIVDPVDDFFAVLNRIGHIPLPPYIDERSAAG